MFLRESGELAGCCGLRPTTSRAASTSSAFTFAGRTEGPAPEASRAVRARLQDCGAVALFAGHHET
jgi:hypothetical protein